VSQEQDRDRTMDGLLRRSLRAPMGPLRGTRAADPSLAPDASGSCLDAETIATWADGELKGKNLEIAEAHLSECARCQALAAALVQTGPGTPSAEPHWWRPGRLGWLVPLSAAALALLVWVAVWVAIPTQERSSSLVSVRAPEPPPAPSKPQTPGTAQELAAAPAVSRAEQRVASVSPRREMKNGAKLIDERAPRARADEALSRGQTAAAGSSAVSVAPPASAPAPAPAAPATLPARNAAGVAGALGDVRIMSKEAVTVSSDIVSVDGTVRWRIIPPASVQRSADGGVTWELLSTGLPVELTGGAAPSGSVCWLVGRGGTVLLSTDGRRWQRMAFPDGADLTAIQATDARTAIVTTADGRRFRTTDGGVSWVPG
jgi:hypothetical protein